MSAASADYLLVTPCRDEAQYARRTLDSVVGQSLRPKLWVIVDDGSRDETPAILAEYVTKHPWIRIVRREDRGKRSVGPGVIDAFYAGLDTVDMRQFEYLCKLDLDLDLPNNYFQVLVERMRADPRLGTCSGTAWFPTADGSLVSEACGAEMSAGMTKFYRRMCFEEIGGFVRAVMWDGIDCHRCRMLGWKAASFDDSELRFTHLRPMGSSQTSLWRGRLRHGSGQWFMGTGFAYVTASALFRMAHRPFIVGGVGIWTGWMRACLRNEPRYGDGEFRSFLQRYQRSGLLLGKRRATEKLDAERGAVWKGGQR
ncbi:MAG: glycosyltransferase [Planctomycetota bacterium]|nr:glycosyltransferase [Planctomycetota bacterium]